jgi:hypothetical protein
MYTVRTQTIPGVLFLFAKLCLLVSLNPCILILVPLLRILVLLLRRDTEELPNCP